MRYEQVAPSFVSLRPGVVRPGPVTRDQVFLAAKTAIAAGLAWVAALAADPHSRPYFAPLAVLLVVQPTVYDSLSRAFQRVVGVVVGVAAALAVSRVLAPSAWSIAIIIFAGLLVGWTTRLGPQGVVQGPVSALLVFLVGQTTPGMRASTLTTALARVQERWGSDPAPWLTFGMTLAMSQRILAEADRPIDPAEREAA
ncbi:MAG: FUSC family protein [Actinobacteria bacterium]|nr:FUSC family protein [Actinomycetota bacterium]